MRIKIPEGWFKVESGHIKAGDRRWSHASGWVDCSEADFGAARFLLRRCYSQGDDAMKTAKKPRKKTPNAKALEELRRLGFEATIVEQTIPHTFIKRDAFGWMDILAINGVNTIGIQVTAGGGSKGESNRNARRVKILAEPRALVWVRSGNLLEIWNYDATGALQREELVLADFN